LDFLKCRRFRQTLLCRSDRQLDDHPIAAKVNSFYIASPIRPAETDVRLDSREPLRFVGPKSSSVETDHPLIKSALTELGKAWPGAVQFQHLLAGARRECEQRPPSAINTADEDARVLGELLLRAYAGGIVEFTVAPPRLVTRPSEKPLASPLARLQSHEGTEVVNLRHFNLQVEDAMTRRLLQILDGTRDHEALLDDLLALVKSGAAAVEMDNREICGDDEALRRFLADELERRLAELAEMGLLVA
jgi:methyltransferase-like protein